MKLYLLDNFDSFTYNLVDQFRCLGFEVMIYRNDVSADYLAEKLISENGKAALVLSPGPGAPHEAGCMMELIAKVAGKVPMLGICLGHQAMVEHYGGKVERAPFVVHGKASPTIHNGEGVFANLPSPLPVARYHSLVATQVPACLEVIASTDDMPMAILHPQDKVVGFQFHPESILTTLGSTLLTQTLTYLTQTSADVDTSASVDSPVKGAL
ncbi:MULTISPECIES: aminodeoxychorismate/anthranilate synthase component II [unclassified Shewanella]|uniref:aminodeoxychorismate/anthranilate synthase component II n=1 Tax=unclassified Shewanella TaxID=196818 RepID=UPI000C86685D|nr:MULTISPECIES: aminodeoxychorismate/anthranilate synthase component II [unclassified Shewanella]MDO6617765.1 aminodeoxychorismate/anthranilate synthase component II [Shewanella sp. 6_MG-2023]MDO6639068.1 aminodeoxychorismate/anthranilate synthase component II [Shewanella sp. 5_MG-2023]MDO6677602.1 aminodeoxychorismate/anthranilate synthase component II [Shewanella sp. 4_MG-2023]MDO6777146.1 aminodeoxychorismate/anthranilate synthase component II [Shewanella sp. 3_MG-2023]PMG42060.1 anthranil